ncbi:MAG: MBL fold metallo-hydrolase [Pseudomonadota bacterium]
MPTSSLLELGGQRIVVDCGLGVTGRLVQAGVDLKSLDTIIITHLHSDHYLELGPLLHTAWTAGLTKQVTIIGPDALADYWRAFLQSMVFDIDLRVADEGRPPLAGLVGIQPMQPERKIGSVTLKTCRNNHRLTACLKA